MKTTSWLSLLIHDQRLPKRQTGRRNRFRQFIRIGQIERLEDKTLLSGTGYFVDSGQRLVLKQATTRVVFCWVWRRCDDAAVGLNGRAVWFWFWLWFLRCSFAFAAWLRLRVAAGPEIRFSGFCFPKHSWPLTSAAG